MKDQLVGFVGELRLDRRIKSFDEAATKQAVILRILSILGWNAYDIDEVKPEYSVDGGSVDYCLRISKIDRVFLEVKKIGDDLRRHQEQLLSYSFKKGVKLAILTNGITWWFYLPLHEGNWEQRRFYTIDILDQEPDEIGSRFIDFLSKDNIASGIAIQNAETTHKDRTKRTIVKDTLSQAWNKIVTESDELINMLGETTEKLCGYKPEREVVKEFLSSNINQLLISAEPPRAGLTDSPALSSTGTERIYPGLTEGKGTSQQAFGIPILAALVELGGRGEMNKVLEAVEAKMKPVLKSTDYAKVPSGAEIRWRNTARWERLWMVSNGLLRSDSPRGIWEITEMGKEYLARHQD